MSTALYLGLTSQTNCCKTNYRDMTKQCMMQYVKANSVIQTNINKHQRCCSIILCHKLLIHIPKKEKCSHPKMTLVRHDLSIIMTYKYVCTNVWSLTLKKHSEIPYSFSFFVNHLYTMKWSPTRPKAD